MTTILPTGETMGKTPQNQDPEVLIRSVNMLLGTLRLSKAAHLATIPLVDDPVAGMLKMFIGKVDKAIEAVEKSVSTTDLLEGLEGLDV